MLWRVFQDDPVQVSRHRRDTVSTDFWRKLARAKAHRDFAPVDDLGERAVVLRILIEEFGGEAVSSTLARRVADMVNWKEAKSELWLRGILGELERCGALSLEVHTQADCIVRIQPMGASLA